MDFRGPTLLKILAAIFAGALAIVSVSAVAEGEPALRATAWLAAEGRLDALTSEPASGVRTTDDSAARSEQIRAGEIIFQTPTLLGGQAAKAGISCASCHVNGRDNPAFQFPGVSGGPGTADVTHSFFSSHRGDGQFNPVTIPDLAEPGKISREKAGELENFVRGLIVEEFDGDEPDVATLNALATYIRAICARCSDGKVKVSVSLHLDRADKALSTADYFAPDQPGLTYLLLSGARHQLSLVYERFTGRKLKRERKALLKLSAKIADLQNAIGTDRNAYNMLSRAAGDQLDDVRDQLVKSENRSLYNPVLLSRRLRMPATGG